MIQDLSGLFDRFCELLNKEIGCKERDFNCQICNFKVFKNCINDVEHKLNERVKIAVRKAIPNKEKRKILESAIGERLEVIQERIKEGSL